MFEKYHLRLVKRWGGLNVLLFYLILLYFFIVGYGIFRTWLDSR